MRRLLSVVIVCFVVMTMFSGCTVLQKLGLQGNDELRPVSSIVMSEDEAKKISDKVPIHLYFANPEGTKLKLEVRYIPMSEAKKSVNTLAATIVKELIKGPSPESGLKPTIPEGSKLRSTVSVKSGIATVDFSKEFVDKHPGGKVAEQLTIFSIVNSLTELKEIQKVKFTINGKAQKEYKGNFQFDAPFPRTTSIISKEVPAPNTGAGDKSKDSSKKDTTKTTPEDTKQKDNTKTTPGDTKQKDNTKSNPGDTKTKDSTKPSSNTLDSDLQVSQDSIIEGDESEATYLETLE